ncbi:MAG: hypothetical protein HUJ26_10840 [Planctomycetaceae bacterium]|nr:hypothetical protein [Planctomycetaceae bacterium]
MSDAYRQQLDKYAESLSIARNDNVVGDLKNGNTAEMLKMFTDGNLDKRFNKVKDQIEFVAEFFDEDQFENLIVQYVKTVPLLAYDTGISDGERFLNWLPEQVELTAEQQDVIRCQQARHQIEEVARENRLTHVAFQGQLTVSEKLAAEFGDNEHLKIQVNPICVRTTFHTAALLGDNADVPAVVQFYPVKNDIRTALLEEDGLEMVDVLHERGAVTLEELQVAMSFKISREELIDLCLELIEMKLATIR